LFLGSMISLKFYRTRQGKILIGLPVAYILWNSCYIGGSFWILWAKYWEYGVEDNIWCYYMKFGLVFTKSLVQMSELSITLWYTLLVKGIIPPAKFEYISHCFIWVFATLVVLLAIFLPHEPAIIVYYICHRNQSWSIALELFDFFHVICIITMIIYVSCYIQRKASSATNSKYFRQILGFPSIYALCILPLCVASLFSSGNVFVVSVHIIRGLEALGCLSGVFSALFYGYTRNIWQRLFKECGNWKRGSEVEPLLQQDKVRPEHYFELIY